jgi:TonB family protein
MSRYFLIGILFSVSAHTLCVGYVISSIWSTNQKHDLNYQLAIDVSYIKEPKVIADNFQQKENKSAEPKVNIKTRVVRDLTRKNIKPIDSTISNEIDIKNTVENNNKVSDVPVAIPNYAYNPPPSYPIIARRKKLQGVVLLKVVVSSQGSSQSISIAKTSGYEVLDDAALQAVKTWNFQPARIGGVAVESVIEVPVRFQLR